MPRDPIVRAEEPETVLHEKSAEVGSVVEPLAVGNAHLDRARVSGRELLLGRRARRVVVDEAVAVELVAAGLRDDVDDAAERAAVLGLVAAGLDLDLLHELVVDRLALDALEARSSC